MFNSVIVSSKLCAPIGKVCPVVSSGCGCSIAGSSIGGFPVMSSVLLIFITESFSCSVTWMLGYSKGVVFVPMSTTWSGPTLARRLSRVVGFSSRVTLLDTTLSGGSFFSFAGVSLLGLRATFNSLPTLTIR